MDEEELNRLAREELLLDTKRAQVRAEMVGAHGWAKPPPTLKANKRFLTTMMLNTVGSSSVKKKPPEVGKRNNRRFSRQITRLVCRSPPHNKKHRIDTKEKSKAAAKKLHSDSPKKYQSRRSSKSRKRKE